MRKLLISHGLWQSRFGGDPGVLGRVVRLRGDSYSVIGVMPPSFRFPERSDVWVPLMARYASYFVPASSLAWWLQRDRRGHQVPARLKTSVELPQAQSALTALAARLEQTYGTASDGVEFSAVSLRDAEVGTFGPIS